MRAELKMMMRRIGNLSPRSLAQGLLGSLLLLTLGWSEVTTAAPDQSATVESSPLVQAGRALQRDDLATAEKQFRAAAEAQPRSPLPWLGLAEVYERRGTLPAALESVRRAGALAPEDAEPVFQAGRLLARLGAPVEALEALAEARRLAPEEGRSYLLAALVLRDVERFEAAIELLEGARAAGLGDPALAEQLGLLLLANGAPAQAQEVAEDLLSVDAGHPGATLVKGLALAGQPEHREEALGWLLKALDLGASDPSRVRLEIATLLLEAGRSEEALEHLHAAREGLPASAEAFYRLGNALRAAGDLEGARSALTRFRELSQEQDRSERVDKELGIALNEVQQLAMQNRLPEAIERLGTLAGAHPSDARIPVLEAKIRFSMGAREEALARLRAGRALAPNEVEIPYLEGVFLYMLERPIEAAAALQAALALNPQLGEAHALLGVLALGWEDPLEAVGHFRRALAAGKDGADLRRAYARALANLGRMEESTEQLEAAQRLGREGAPGL